MRIRPLKPSDAPLMLEWMHDPAVLTYLRMDGESKTILDAEAFIAKAQNMEHDAHFAVADGADEYLGTVSLKNIDPTGQSAEFAISLRSCAQGKGCGTYAACAAMEYGFGKRGLKSIWLDVIDQHKAGVACYERAGFRRQYTLPEPLKLRGQSYTLSRYACGAEQFDPDWRKSFTPPDLAQVKRLSFQQRGDERGRLVIAECGKEVPFPIRRIFYIYGSDGNVVRGSHANRRSEFVLINVAGSSKVRATDGKTEAVYELNRAHEGLYLPRMIWKEMYAFSQDSVLLVLSSVCYDPAEYIRDYDAYLTEVKRFE